MCDMNTDNWSIRNKHLMSLNRSSVYIWLSVRPPPHSHHTFILICPLSFFCIVKCEVIHDSPFTNNIVFSLRTRTKPKPYLIPPMKSWFMVMMGSASPRWYTGTHSKTTHTHRLLSASLTIELVLRRDHRERVIREHSSTAKPHLP